MFQRCLHAALCVASLVQGLPPATAQSLSQSSECGTFYDKWNIPGAPETTLVTFGMAHKLLAARDCVSRRNTSMACEHYRKVLWALDRLGPQQAAQLGPDVKARMVEAGCR
jgi:hypothetical protein